MKYNRLGCAGIKVSELAYGSYLTFGEKMDFQQSRACMKAAFDHGINFFDNAEVYNCGLSESIMGRIVKYFRREDVVLATKLFFGDGGDGPNDSGLSWKHLVEGIKNSLRRLDTEYVDILYCHRPDADTPIEETVRAMDYIIKSGMAFYWGTSEWSQEQIEAAYSCAEKNFCIPPSSEQSQYNLLVRNKVEVEFSPLYKRYKMGMTAFSPLASGVLTGKYKGLAIDDLLRSESSQVQVFLTGENFEKIDVLHSLAGTIGCSLAQLSLAWCLKNDNVSSVILGASSVEQIKENIQASEIKEKLSDDIMAEISNIIT